MEQSDKGLTIEYFGKIDNKIINKRKNMFIKLVNERITFYENNKFYFYTNNDYLNKFFLYVFNNKKHLKEIKRNEDLNDFPDFYFDYKNDRINLEVKRFTDFFSIKSSFQLEKFNKRARKLENEDYFHSLRKITLDSLKKYDKKEKQGVNLICIFINEMNIMTFRDYNDNTRDRFWLEKSKQWNELIKKHYNFIDGIIFCVLDCNTKIDPNWLNEAKKDILFVFK